MTQAKEIPPMHILKTLARKFMSTTEILELGLTPNMESAGEWRRLIKGSASWVPSFLPNTAMASVFCLPCKQTPNVMETIVIWNTDTFDTSGLDLDKRTYAEIEKDYKESNKV